jgi:hypothetical protein
VYLRSKKSSCRPGPRLCEEYFFRGVSYTYFTHHVHWLLKRIVKILFWWKTSFFAYLPKILSWIKENFSQAQILFVSMLYCKCLKKVNLNVWQNCHDLF